MSVGVGRADGERAENDPNVVHVTPLPDEPAHRTDGLCWCQPIVEDVPPDGRIYIHRRTLDSPHIEMSDEARRNYEAGPAGGVCGFHAGGTKHCMRDSGHDGEHEPVDLDPIRQDMTTDEAIGYALLETEHIGGFARRGPSFRERLAEAGYFVLNNEALAEALYQSQAARRDGDGLGSHEADARAILAAHAKAAA